MKTSMSNKKYLNRFFLLSLAILTVGTNAKALEVGDTAPCVVLQQIEKDDTLKEYCIRERSEGGQFTVIEFFQTTCTDCQINLPKFSALAEELVGKGTFRQIALDRRQSDILTYIQDNRPLLGFPVALDLARDAKVAYNVRATPTLFVLDSNYKVMFKHVGVLSSEDESRIRTILQSVP